MFYLAVTLPQYFAGQEYQLKVLKLDNCRGAGIYLYMIDILLHSITCSLLDGQGAK